MSLPVRVAFIGVGAVAEYHHLPAIHLDSRAELVAICDPHVELLQQRQREWSVAKAVTSHTEIANDTNIDAVVIATPNLTHHPIALDCIAAGKHIMCEKPLGLNFQEAEEMFLAANAKGIRHMTAFTYRFAPAMRYVKHLVQSGQLGEPRHFRSQRFLDWAETSWGWRQYKQSAGAGDLFDMTIHRIDFAQDLLGPIQSVCGAVAQFVPRDKTKEGDSCPPSEVDDWSSLIGQFENGAVGVWEGSTLMKGYDNNGFGYEWAEINGSKGSAAYQLTDPNFVMIGLNGAPMERKPVPEEYLKPLSSPRDPHAGEPSTVFRYDLMWEFISAIQEERPAISGFDCGASAQKVADAVLESFEKRKWIDLLNTSP
ncbi:oxidoreductase domain protein [hydrothermal vent metagenome]|uniref:Oxidoreductase domain protein n=1 Tax=hydrothermal vent metagenome TaxID=652676 RepID=A0A3B1DAW8_9ZZZZ